MKYVCTLTCLLALLLVAASTSAAEEPSDEMVKTILELIGDKDKDMRGLGLDQVRSELKGAAATRRIAAELPKFPPDIQVGLLSALADRRDAAARPAVLALLETKPGEGVRVAAIAALGTLGEAGDLPLLIKTLGEGSEAEQNAAKATLGKLPGEKVNSLLAAELKGAPPAVRSALIDALSTRRAYDIVPSLLPGTLDADPAVRMAAMAALAQLAGPEQIPALLQGVLKAEAGAERETAEKAVVTVSNRIENPDERATPLLAAFAKLSAADQLALLSLLGRQGSPQVLPTLDEALSSGDTTRRQTALEALALWPDGTIVDKLVTLTKNAKDPDDRAIAFRALVRASSIRDKRSDSERLDRLKQAMALAQSPEEKKQVLSRCRTAYHIDSLRYVLPYLDDPAFTPVACETVVELAHHRELRQPNKEEFDKALDKVLALTSDDVLKDRANRYKAGQTWERPKTKPAPKVADVVEEDLEADDTPAAAISPQVIGGVAVGVFVLVLAFFMLRRGAPRT